MSMNNKQEKKIVAIWAEDENGLIGADGRLPWHLPKELKHFKETTTGHALLMGRVTFDGMKRRVLPNRETLILTRDENFQAEGVKVLNSLKEVLTWFDSQDKNLYVVGGASIYKVFENYYDELIRTKVHGTFTGDTYFPELDWSDFQGLVSTDFDKDDKNPYAFTVTVWEKK